MTFVTPGGAIAPMARGPIYNFPVEPNLIRWSAAWQKAADFLAREREERLRNMTDDDVRAAVAAIFTGTGPTMAPVRESGLIEQQRLFRKVK